MKFINYLKKVRTENIFNKYDLIYIYIFGGLIGTIYEEIYHLISSNKFVNCSGSVFLPFNIVYGLGVLLITICFYKVSNLLIIWLLSSFLCGIVEYFMSLISELFLSAESWNYRYSLLNINGRTTIPYMIIWGFFSLIIITLVIPFYIKLIHKIPSKIHKIISIILSIIILIDLMISFYALIRYTQRHYNIYINNPISNWFDDVFDNKFMQSKYPNFHFLDE